MFSSNVTTRTSWVTLRFILHLCLAGFFIDSALSQTTWEFSGTPYAYQKAHFDSATVVVRTKLGLQMHTFGAPYNQIDATFLQVMSEDTSYKVLLLGQQDPSPASGQKNFKNRVFIESATGVPDYSYFLTDYNSKKATYTDYMVMQGHPYAWTTQQKLTEFQNIVKYLIADSVVFNTPYGYYKYLTDLSIPRTNKVQVLLKLDDLRAATTYFYPCLPTYDFLAANMVKASFGVNKLEALTQAQIDTLHYYLAQTTLSGDTLFEIWNHGLDHSTTAATVGGNWSSASSWPSGAVPISADDVVIPAGVTITVDIPDAVCNDLTIDGTLVMLNTTVTGLTVNGDVVINSGGSFTSPSLTGATANIMHTLYVYGDFSNSGGTFDFRTGSAGTTLRAINTTFLGNYNSTITVGTYSSSNNDFNGITINKSGGAKVICASDVVCDPGSSTGKSLLTLTNGIVETGNYAIYALSTTSADIVTPSVSSYINGALGRGMSNSAGKSCPFPVGDARGYRPMTVTSTNAGIATGHNVVVRCIPASANTGSSTFTGGIAAVSGVRYYQISYNKGIGAAADSMGFKQFSPGYGTDDGVVAGNTNLRVAYSTDNRLTWNGITQTITHTTNLTSPPTTITPDTLASPTFLLNGARNIFVSLATLTAENPLPTQLASFTGRVLVGGTVRLEWITISEVNNYGFYIQRRGTDASSWEDVPNSFIPGHGTTSLPQHYSFVDSGAFSAGVNCRLQQVDLDGAIHYSDPIRVNGVTSVTSGAPAVFLLSQNYPNPFNPVTGINFSVERTAKASLEVFDISGRKVAILFDDVAEAGRYYNVKFVADNVASGVYLYRLQSGDSVQSKRLVLLK